MIYTQILEIPNQQLDRYFNSFRELAASRPLSELRTAEELEAVARAKGEFKNQERYMVLVEGEDEQRSFSPVYFLLPMLCQITMEIDGCRLIASYGAYKAVVECLIRLVEEDGGTAEENGPIFLACDTILNLLLKREEIGVHMDDSYFIKLLGCCHHGQRMMLTGKNLILDSTSETVLECHPHFTLLLDKKPDEVPMLVESVLSKVMEEFENRITSQVELDFRVVFDQELGLILKLRDMMIGWIYEGFQSFFRQLNDELMKQEGAPL
ncbi:unnamed protein product [Lactuca virosa]|uniref:Uncharacterized protein n=1 Tax=Lactuca virosa TaxID=75947 RepID=A0AAU9MEN7_9ASTR|nr:unnamed protein product [Lactuca virosa]